MTERRKPPPRFPRPGDPELVRVSEDEAPATQREVILPPPPREPFRLVKRAVTLDTLAEAVDSARAEVRDLSLDIRGLNTTQAAILGVQRNMALQADGLGTTINARFDLFHEELAMLRIRVTGVEKTAGQKAAAVASKGGAVAGLLALGSIAAARWPEYAHIINLLLGGP